MHEWKNFLTKVRWFCLVIYIQFPVLTETVSPRHYQKLNCVYFVCLCIRHCVCVWMRKRFFFFLEKTFMLLNLIANLLSWWEIHEYGKVKVGIASTKPKDHFLSRGNFAETGWSASKISTLDHVAWCREVDGDWQAAHGPKWSYIIVWQNI